MQLCKCRWNKPPEENLGMNFWNQVSLSLSIICYHFYLTFHSLQNKDTTLHGLSKMLFSIFWRYLPLAKSFLFITICHIKPNLSKSICGEEHWKLTSEDHEFEASWNPESNIFFLSIHQVGDLEWSESKTSWGMHLDRRWTYLRKFERIRKSWLLQQDAKGQFHWGSWTKMPWRSLEHCQS